MPFVFERFNGEVFERTDLGRRPCSWQLRIRLRGSGVDYGNGKMSIAEGGCKRARSFIDHMKLIFGKTATSLLSKAMLLYSVDTLVLRFSLFY